MSRRSDWATFTGTSDVELSISIDDVLEAFGRDELLAALGEDPHAGHYATPAEELVRDIDLELYAVKDPSARLALNWVRDRVTSVLGVAA